MELVSIDFDASDVKYQILSQSAIGKLAFPCQILYRDSKSLWCKHTIFCVVLWAICKALQTLRSYQALFSIFFFFFFKQEK